MGFSREVKLKVLLSCARHCCVCHRYTGVKVEVHHIVPKDKGGSDSFQNAIALCFDCHCDAGHYHARHPRGTKFSKDELIASRDLWYESVKNGGIASPQGDDILYCRYLLCKGTEVFREITRGELNNIPFTNTLLVDNLALSFQRQILQIYSDQTLRSMPSRISYKNIDSYLAAFPDAIRSDGFYETARTPSLSELTELAKTDSFLRQLLQVKVPPFELAVAVGMTVEPGCGGLPHDFVSSPDRGDLTWFDEHYCVRSIWGAFLAITNESSGKVRFNSISGNVEEVTSIGYRQFSQHGGNRVEMPLPAAPILPGGTILIPLGVIMPPLQYVPCQPGSVTNSPLEGKDGYYQELFHTGYETDNSRNFHVVGPLFRPTSIAMQYNGIDSQQEVHKLDMTNLYVLDRNFGCGSCPHIFLIDNNNRCIYGGELFSNYPGKVSTMDLKIPMGTKVLIIAELQKERTYIESVICGSNHVLCDIWLEENDFLRIPNVEGKCLTFKGYYEMETLSAKLSPQPSFLNEIVSRFISRANTDTCLIPEVLSV